jgi:hypothetical protein
MQRRAAAVLFVFFMVMGASAYSVISFAETPEIQLEGAPTYENGSNFTAGGQEYRVLAQMEESSGGGGGHGGGGGGGAAPAGTLQWYVPETTQNQTYENGSTAEVFNGTWLATTGVAPNLENAYVNTDGNVTALSAAGQQTGSAGNASGNDTGGAAAGGNATNATGGNATAGNATGGNATAGNATGGNATAATANASGSTDSATSAQANTSEELYTDAPNSLVFTNTTDITAVLESDPAVYNETITSEGQTFVRYQSNGTFVPLADYLQPAEQTRVQQGDSFDLQIEIDTFDGSKTLNVSATVVNVTNTSAVVEYTAPQYNTAELAQGGNVTLANGEQRVVNFLTETQGNETSVSGVQLGSNYSAYAQQSDVQESFADRMTGLWNVIIISALAGMLVVGLAFLPVRG